MSRELSRRATLALAGTTATVSIAGCGGGGDGDGDGGDGNGGNGGGGNVPGVDDSAWDDVSEFHFTGQIPYWGGVEPADVIGDTENPTIVLIEGNEYTFTWENADGATHNLEIRNDSDEIVEDYQSETVSEEGGEASIEGLVATTEMTTYICQYHPTTQVGDIEIRSS